MKGLGWGLRNEILPVIRPRLLFVGLSLLVMKKGGFVDFILIIGRVLLFLHVNNQTFRHNDQDVQ